MKTSMSGPRNTEKQRVPVFVVTTKKWDNVYGCYYDHALSTCDSFEKAETFAKSYDGTEPYIEIKKAYHFPEALNKNNEEIAKG